MPRKIGYARVSTEEQNLDMQIDALQKEGCDLIFQEHASGTVRDRKELNKSLDILQEGDILVVWDLDRLGRDPNHISNIVYQLKEKNIKIKSLSRHIDSETPEGRMIIGIYASLGEIEAVKIRMRTRAGQAAARKRGVIFGRPKKDPLDKTVLAVKHLAQNTNMTKKEIALEFDIGRTTVYEYLKL